MANKKTKLDWKWSKGIKPSGRPVEEVLANARKKFLEKEGRLYTVEECIKLTDEIRKELRAKGELK